MTIQKFSVAPRCAAAQLGPEVCTGSELPLGIDLFAGLGGWTEGFLAEGYRVVGFDIEIRPYPAQLVIQDVLTIHGSQFKDAACIVASPPCQQYSWLAMPWSRSTSEHSQAAKALRRKWETEGPDNRLFDACFRIQREAMIARRHDCCSRCSGPHHCCRPDCYPQSPMHVRYIPLIVENVRGAQPWVGRAAWSYGSFYLWGDVPALMPLRYGAIKNPGYDAKSYRGKAWNDEAARNLGYTWGQKVAVYSDPRLNGGKGSHLTCPDENIEKLQDGLKIGGDWFSDPKSTCRKHGSRSAARKAASAQIAKIPFELARWVAHVCCPRTISGASGRLAAPQGKT